MALEELPSVQNKHLLCSCRVYMSRLQRIPRRSKNCDLSSRSACVAGDWCLKMLLAIYFCTDDLSLNCKSEPVPDCWSCKTREEFINISLVYLKLSQTFQDSLFIYLLDLTISDEQAMKNWPKLASVFVLINRLTSSNVFVFIHNPKIFTSLSQRSRETRTNIHVWRAGIRFLTLFFPS